ncbi:MAG TPA: Spy/CpxP family protein refolding chaperone [Verrucomicrobiae bacterium]|nr:Spy/CpxP family protein refolding chaperone [Verrucomicrobiae bacterium]
MKTKTIFIITAAAIIAGGFIISTSLAADNPEASPLRGQMFQRLAERLDLTADQKAQIKTILADEKDALKSLLGQLHDARTVLREAIQAGDANESSVRAASAKAASVEADMAVERMKLFSKISPVLTAEQRQKIDGFAQRADDFADSLIARLGEGLAE